MKFAVLIIPLLMACGSAMGSPKPAEPCDFAARLNSKDTVAPAVAESQAQDFLCYQTTDATTLNDTAAMQRTCSPFPTAQVRQAAYDAVLGAFNVSPMEVKNFFCSKYLRRISIESVARYNGTSWFVGDSFAYGVNAKVLDLPKGHALDQFLTWYATFQSLGMTKLPRYTVDPTYPMVTVGIAEAKNLALQDPAGAFLRGFVHEYGHFIVTSSGIYAPANPTSKGGWTDPAWPDLSWTWQQVPSTNLFDYYGKQGPHFDFQSARDLLCLFGDVVGGVTGSPSSTCVVPPDSDGLFAALRALDQTPFPSWLSGENPFEDFGQTVFHYLIGKKFTDITVTYKGNSLSILNHLRKDHSPESVVWANKVALAKQYIDANTSKVLKPYGFWHP